MEKNTIIKLVISGGALVLLVVRFMLPQLKIDAVSIGLLVVCILPWAPAFVESLKAPGGWELKLRELATKVEKVIDASSEGASEPTAPDTEPPELTDSESKVLELLTKADVPLRSVFGIRKDAGPDVTDIPRALDSLDEKGLATKVDGKLGIRWGITPDGRRRLKTL